MFSKRTQWNLSPNRLSVLLAEKRMRGENIIDLTESNPTQCGFNYPHGEIISSLTDDAIFSYQPNPRGHIVARESIAEHYNKLGISVSPESIILTSSTSEAYSYLFKLLCDTNDEIIVPSPSYPLFDYLAQLNDVKLRHYRLLYNGEWHIDFESLGKAFTKNTKAIILVHPNNPTGSFIKQEEFERVCLLADQRNCSIIVDEVFESYTFSNTQHRANIISCNTTVPVFSLNGISKLLGLPQLKLSWIIVSGKSKHKTEILNRLDIIADTYLSVNTPVQTALTKLLLHSSNISKQILTRVRSNYNLLQNTFLNSSVSLFNAEGGWYAILKLPQNKNDENWAYDILSNLNILINPGHYFDIEQKSCIVLSLLPKTKIYETETLHLRQFIEQN